MKMISKVNISSKCPLYTYKRVHYTCDHFRNVEETECNKKTVNNCTKFNEPLPIHLSIADVSTVSPRYN